MRGSIRKQGRDTWQIRYYVDGKQRSETVRGKKADAQARLAAVLHQLQTGEYVEPAKLSLGEYLSRWLASVKPSVRPTTYDSYETMVRRHIAPALGSVPLAKVTPLHIQQLLAGVRRADGREGPLSARTVRYVFTVLHMALDRAVKWQLLARNPCDAVEPPRPERYELQLWTPDQACAFLEHVADDRLYPLYLLAVTSGLRRGELLGLRWQDLDLDAGGANVRQAVVAVGGKPVVAPVKTARGRRTVALSPTALGALRQHRKRVAEEKLLLGPDYHDFDLVFPYPDGRPHCPNALAKKFARVVASAGLPRIRFHDLRHLHATLLLRQGIHPKVVADRLGHFSAAFTLDTYSHAGLDLQREAAARAKAELFRHKAKIRRN